MTDTSAAHPATAPDPSTGAAGHVFISYASGDQTAAQRICAALEGAGFPCWLAPRDVRAGDSYAASIVEAINSCRILVLVLTRSAIESPHVLREVERASSKRRTILAVRLDTTPLRSDLEYFLSTNHWLEATDGSVERLLPALVESVRGRSAATSPPTPGPAAVLVPPRQAPTGPGAARRLMPIALGVLAMVVVGLVVERFMHRAPAPAVVVAPPAAPPQPTPAIAAAPAHSVAVLPFTNMSGDAKDDYFSDGLSQELLNTLAAVQGLKVAARTSSFSFKGKDDAVSDIAKKLNVATVLEGSVRRDKSHVRISAELIDAGTGFQLWSQTYDRDLKDVLSLQTAIATAVSNALKVTLLTDGAHGLELGGTENPKAFDAYLRGESLSQKPFSVANNVQGLAAYDEAIALDQRYVNAYIGRALTLDNLYLQGPNLSQAEAHRTVLAALASARKAVELAPSLGVAHSTVGGMLESMLDYRGALAEYQKGLSLSPGDSRVYRSSARFLAAQGHGDQAIIEARRAVELDPVNPRSHRTLAYVYLMTRHFAESIESYNRAAQIDPTPERQRSDWLGVLYYGLGQYAAARDHCESHAQDWVGYTCLAIVYQKLGRLADAEAQLKKLQDTYGDSASFQQTEIYAQWGDIPRALDALHRAVAMPDPGVGLIKADFLVDPLRNEPRFKAVVAKLGFPD